jgi:2-polyprenyl-3-methyl-5-hydroxy-6-metoxy-1,4-benzoquinol methylase
MLIFDGDGPRLKSINYGQTESIEVRFQTHVIDSEAEMAALRALGGLDGARVLEIGCRDGRLTFRYAPAARSVVAIDPRAEAIAKAREMLPVELAERIRFEIGSALELDQPPATFDIGLLSHSL